MKKIIIVLLLMVSTNVFAEWTAYGGSKDVIGYVDFGTIKKKGNKVKMWNMSDLKTVKEIRGVRFLSVLSHKEFDCEEETKRDLDLYFYSGNMRTGDIVSSEKNIKEEPESITPGDGSEVLFKIACGKK